MAGAHAPVRTRVAESRARARARACVRVCVLSCDVVCTVLISHRSQGQASAQDDKMALVCGRV